MTKYKISYHIEDREGRIIHRDECFYPSVNHKELVAYEFLYLVNCYDQITEDEFQNFYHPINNSWYKIDSIKEVSC